MSGLSLRDISLTFPDGTEAVSSANLEVSGGEFVSIVGPSGCGKSTLLRVASGLLAPTSGSVAIDSSSVGYVFQDPTLLPWRTTRHNVELLAELRNVSLPIRRERADRILSTVGLTEFADHYPRALSGGMKMRVSLARTLMLEPTVCLFDEPFGALDEMTREHLNGELIGIFLARRFAAVFVTHSISEAVFMSSRVHVMSSRPGRLGAPIDVPFDYPRVPELRFTPEFAETCGRVARALRETT
jgi:NitT/TauT family transport system ATP-binding protein